MTEQNNLAREIPDDSQNEDPLEELARIVSGGIDLDAVRKEAAVQEDPALEEEAAQQTVEDMAYDLESELMRELGTERFEGDVESEPAATEPAAAEADDVSEFGQFDHPVKLAEETPAEPVVEQVIEAEAEEAQDFTLEDQLMAELDPAEAEVEQVQSVETPPEAVVETEVEQPTGTDQSATPPETTRRDTSFADRLPPKAVVAEEPVAEEAQQDQAVEEAAEQANAEDFDFASAFAQEVEAEAANIAEAHPEVPVSAELPEPAEVQIDAAAEALAVRQAQAAVAESLAAEIPVDLESENLEGDHDVDAAEQDLRSDLSAAFEAELSQLGLEQQDDTPEPEPIDEPETAPIAAEVAGDTLTAQTANTIVSRASAIPNKADLDDEFAKAFAKELDLGSLSKAKPATQANPEPLPIEPEQAIQDALQEEEVDWSGTSQGDALPDFDMPGAFEGAGQVLQEADLDVDANAEHYSAQEDNSEKRRGGFKLAAGALGAALVVGAGAIAYSYFSGSPSITAPVTIKADSDPVKVKPDDPGGTTIANQDKAAYERVTGEFASDTRQETLVKSTETPVDVPGRDVEQTNSTTPATASQDNKEENRLSPNTQTREFAAAPVLEPRRVKTVTVNPDGTVVKPQAALPFQAAEPAGEPDPNSIGGAVSTGQIGVPATRPSPAENSATVTAAAGGNAPIALAPNPVESRLSRSPLPSESSIAATPAVSTSSSQPGSAASPTTAPAQTETASVTPAPAAPIVSNSSGNAAAAGNWAVQISSQRTAEDAQTTYQRMREQYSEVIGNQQMSIQRAEIEGKGVFFRVRVMAQTREEALDICSRLKSAGGSCFVTQ